MRYMNRAQVEQLAGDLVDLVSKLSAAELELRVRASSRDVLRSGGAVGGGSGGGPAIIVDDEDGEPDTIRVTTVEAAVFAGAERRTEYATAQRLAWVKLHEARNALTDAFNACEPLVRAPKAAAVDDDEKPPPSTKDIWCTSCARIGEINPRGTPKDVGVDSTLCAWCHAYQRDTGALPHELLLRRRVEKRGRLTERDYQEVAVMIRRQTKTTKKKGKKR